MKVDKKLSASGGFAPDPPPEAHAPRLLLQARAPCTRQGPPPLASFGSAATIAGNIGLMNHTSDNIGLRLLPEDAACEHSEHNVKSNTPPTQRNCRVESRQRYVLCMEFATSWRQFQRI